MGTGIDVTQVSLIFVHIVGILYDTADFPFGNKAKRAIIIRVLGDIGKRFVEDSTEASTAVCTVRAVNIFVAYIVYIGPSECANRITESRCAVQRKGRHNHIAATGVIGNAAYILTFYACVVDERNIRFRSIFLQFSCIYAILAKGIQVTSGYPRSLKITALFL